MDSVQGEKWHIRKLGRYLGLQQICRNGPHLHARHPPIWYVRCYKRPHSKLAPTIPPPKNLFKDCAPLDVKFINNPSAILPSSVLSARKTNLVLSVIEVMATKWIGKKLCPKKLPPTFELISLICFADQRLRYHLLSTQLFLSVVIDMCLLQSATHRILRACTLSLTLYCLVMVLSFVLNVC